MHACTHEKERKEGRKEGRNYLRGHGLVGEEALEHGERDGGAVGGHQVARAPDADELRRAVVPLDHVA